ncbi:MAG: UPF0262 family protein [Alphaproteobacteria bacterium]|nr:UPF0262 family protein [Alphaproteobacteria bacterium]
MTQEASQIAPQVDAKKARIAKIELDQGSITYRSPEIEHERAIAIADLQDDNQFVVVGAEDKGPYYILLSVADNRLNLMISSCDDALEQKEEIARILVPIAPFRRIIKDYFMICESYFEAIKQGSMNHIEAIDMGRRGIHNEGSEQLIALLRDKATFDFETSRRLFTLICVLHIK